MGYSIAIDGPSGAGKSTIAKRIANELSFIYVDTGAMYRAIALYLLNKGVAIEPKVISGHCKNANVTIEYLNGEQQVILNGENVNAYIRAEEVGNMASTIAVNPDVRMKLVDLQRQMAKVNNVVMDGRDIGSKVLPNAELKIYLFATSKIRAERRFLELQKRNEPAMLAEIEKDIIERDRRDMTREISPLIQAEDAKIVDSSNMSIDEVAELIIKLYFEDKNNN
jgi:cytidylate kinase